jgi:mannose-6-phosphate isomerase-like protein (cupin superfamily)
MEGTTMKGNMNDTSPPLKAFKRAPSLGLSQWENGNLTTNLAEKKDTNGAFFLVEAMLAPGTQPPPHVHSREDELFYVLEGEFDVYVGQDAFKVEAGECVFLPRFKPHTFVIRSPWLRVLALFTPAGLEEAFRGMSTPAQRLELPTGVATYSTGDLKQTAQRLLDYGAQILAPEEVAEQMPLYPKPLPPNVGKFTTDSTTAFISSIPGSDEADHSDRSTTQHVVRTG